MTTMTKHRFIWHKTKAEEKHRGAWMLFTMILSPLLVLAALYLFISLLALPIAAFLR